MTAVLQMQILCCYRGNLNLIGHWRNKKDREIIVIPMAMYNQHPTFDG
jgi:hypothetical protein